MNKITILEEQVKREGENLAQKLANNEVLKNLNNLSIEELKCLKTQNLALSKEIEEHYKNVRLFHFMHTIKVNLKYGYKWHNFLGFDWFDNFINDFGVALALQAYKDVYDLVI